MSKYSRAHVAAVCASAVLAAAPAQGHPGLHQAPNGAARATPSAPLYAYRNNAAHMGYGYLSDSEAEADEAFEFSCSDHARMGYFRQACGATAATLDDQQLAELEDARAAVTQSAFEDKLRLKTLEHIGLQLYALAGGTPSRVPDAMARNCLGDEQRQSPELQALDRLPAQALTPGRRMTTPQVQAVRNATSPEFADRANIVAAQLSDENLAGALVLGAYYTRALQANGCTEAARRANNETPTCRGIHRTIFRLRNSYPVIFNDDLAYPRLTADAMTILSDKVVGALTSGVDSAALTAVLNGTDGVATRGPSDLIAQIDAVLPTPRGAGLRTAFSELRAAYRQRLETLRGRLCDMNAFSLVTADPAAMRQLMVDAAGSSDPAELALVRYSVCGNSAYTQDLRPNSCGRAFSQSTVTQPNEPAYQWINGTSVANYPFTGDVSYGMASLPNGRTVVKQNVVIVIPPGATPPNAAQVQDWATRSQAFFNDGARRLGRPVDFSFSFGTSTTRQPNSINITWHQCWCSTCSSTLPPPNSVPPPRDACVPGRMMQADSGNWHSQVNMSTVLHEVGHGLGLGDEYQADYYPFNALGETNSVMRQQGGPDTLYARHLDQILHPHRCD